MALVHQPAQSSNAPIDWFSVAVPCPPDQAEDFCALLMASGSTGAQLFEDRVLAWFAADVWTPPGIRRLLRQWHPTGCRSPEIHGVATEAWADQWQQFFRPVRVSARIRVLPVWMDPAPFREPIVIRIRPGQGFGTGSHGSTKTYLRLLEWAVRPGVRFLDAGCGSGIGSIAALRLGAGLVTPVDVSPAAVADTRYHLRLNGLRARTLCRDVQQFRPRPVDLVGANMLVQELEFCWEALTRAVRPGGLLVLSGLLDTHRRRVGAWLRAAGFRCEAVRRSGEWLGLAARKVS